MGWEMKQNQQNEKSEFALPPELEEYLSKPLPLKLPNPNLMAQRAMQAREGRVKKWEVGIIYISATLTAIAMFQKLSNWWNNLSFTIEIPVTTIIRFWDKWVLDSAMLWFTTSIIILSYFIISKKFFQKR